MKEHEKIMLNWESVPRILYKNKNNLSDLLTDDDMRIRIQFFCVFFIFMMVSTVMTVVNVITSWRLLMLSTLIFAIANLINMILMLIGPRCELLTRYLFAVEILTLFAFFILFGEPEGFSAIWIALLPACGFLLYRVMYGILISSVQFVILVFLFWTDAGRSLLMYDYTSSFLLRFPLLYSAFFFVGIFFEFTRHLTQKELVATRYNYEQLSKHDPLTALYNRLGFYEVIEKFGFSKHANGCAMAIMDFDSFKYVNDRFGHLCGDEVLKRSSVLIAELVGDAGCVCRWGGDELAIFFKSAKGSEKICSDIVEKVREIEYVFDSVDFHSTVSVGLITVADDKECTLAELIASADKNLYYSKSAGKDRLAVTDISSIID